MAKEAAAGTHKVLPLLDTTCSATTVAGCCVWVLDFVWWWCRRLHYVWIQNNLGGGVFWIQKVFVSLVLLYLLVLFIRKVFVTFGSRRFLGLDLLSKRFRIFLLRPSVVGHRPPNSPRLSIICAYLCIPYHCTTYRQTVGGEFIIVGSSVPVRRKSRK
jgi:hypothetical protein